MAKPKGSTLGIGFLFALLPFMLFIVLTAGSVNSKQQTKAQYAHEIYGDADIFKGPRLQFVWRAPGEDKWSIWSIRLNGTDLRRVVDYELLYRNGDDIDHPPVRSPNNRYLITSMYCKEGSCKNLFDIKSMTVKTVARGGTVPYFQWTADSQNVILYLDVDLYKYNIFSEKLIKIPQIYSRGLYLLRDNKFLAIERTGFSFYSSEGQLIQSVTLGKNIYQHHAATPDGRLLMYHDRDKNNMCFIIRTDDPEHPIYSDGIFRFHAAFGPAGNMLYYAGEGGIYRLEITSKRIERVFDPPGDDDRIRYLAILNPIVAKVGGLQSQGGKGEAVALYCKPLPTQDLEPSGFPAG